MASTRDLIKQMTKTNASAQVNKSVPVLGVEQAKQSASVPTLQNNANIIQEYESIPNYNVLERMFDKNKAAAYERKASLMAEYKVAKDKQISDFINQNNLTRDELLSARRIAAGNGNFIGNADAHKKISELAQKSGIDVNDVYAYANANALEDFSNKATEDAEGHGVRNYLGARAMNLLGGIVGAAGETANYITGKPIGSADDVNVISSLGGRLDQANKEQIANNAKTETGKNVGQFAYDIGASIGDMATSIAVGGKGGSLGLMATTAGANTLNQQKDKNTSQDQKVATAVVSGLAEALTEKLPLENLFKMAKAPAKATIKTLAANILKQSATEASEEAITEIVNTIADNIINKGESDYQQSVKNYLAQGMTMEQANNQATVDVIANVGMSALAGGVSGGIMAGGATAIGSVANNARQNAEANRLYENATNPTTDPIQQIRDNFNRVPNNYDSNSADVLTDANTYSDTVNADDVAKVNGNAQAIPSINYDGNGANYNFRSGVNRTEGGYSWRGTPVNGFSQQSNNIYGILENMLFGGGQEASKAFDLLNEFQQTKDTSLLKQAKDILTTLQNEAKKSANNSELTKRNYSLLRRSINELFAGMDSLRRANESGEFNADAENGSIGEYQQNEPMNRFATEADNAISDNADVNRDSFTNEDSATKNQYPVVDVSDAKKVEGFDSLTKDLQKLINMFGTENAKALSQQVYGYLNDFAKTGNKQSYQQALKIAELIEAELEGRTYTNKSGKNSVKSQNNRRVHTYEPYSFYETIMAYANDLANASNNTVANNSTNNDNNVGTKIPSLLSDAETSGIIRQNFDGNDNENTKVNNSGIPSLFSNNTEADTTTPTTGTPTSRSGAIIGSDGSPRTPGTPPVTVRSGGSEGTRTGNPSVTSRNSYKNSKVFNKYEESRKWLKNEIANGTYDVDYISEDASMEDAAARLDADREGEIEKLYNAKSFDGVQIDESMMIMEDLVDEAVRTGDWSKVKEFSTMANQKIHKMAQGLQALAKHTRSAVSAIMKTGAIAEKFGKKIDISDADMAEVKRLFDLAEDAGIDTKKGMEFEEQAYKVLAKYLPAATFQEKWNSWRYLAMLGNTRTHIRNMIGNIAFGLTTDVKDSLAGALETVFIRDKSKRTKSIASTDPKLLKRSKADAETVWRQLTEGGNKFNMTKAIEQQKRIFKNNVIEYLRKKNGDALTAEDNNALVRKYKHALAGYLQAHGADSSIFDSTAEADVKLLDDARAYAIKQAQIATFHEDNKLANFLNKCSAAANDPDAGSVGKVAGFILESIVPFKKTPANILKQGVIEYNPLKIVQGLYDVVKHGDNPAKALDEVARGLTGSAVMALGFILAQKGILRGKQEDESGLDKLTGEQDFSININGHSYTIDWLAPTALPLFVGEALYRYSAGEDMSVIDALSTIADPVVEMSMLQGLNNALEQGSSFAKDKSTLIDTTANVGLGYFSQGVPTLFGQLARSIDDTRRSTYTGKTGTVDTFARQIEKTENKIPFLSMTNQAYVNQWGEEQKNAGGNIAGRLFMNMISPGYYSNATKSETEQELYRLSDLMQSGKIDKSTIVPSLANKTYDGERLNQEDYNKYATIKGQNVAKFESEAINSAQYKALDDEHKADMLHKILNFSDAVSKKEMFGYDIESSGTYKKAYSVYQDRGMDGLINYLYMEQTYGGSKQEDLINYLEGSKMSDDDKAYFFMLKNGKPSNRAQLLNNDKYVYDYYRIKNMFGSKTDEFAFGLSLSDLPDEEKAAIEQIEKLKDDEVKFLLSLQ